MKKSKIDYNSQELAHYLKDLQLIGALSNLFSENSVPMLNYRVSENIYCKNFSAENLSRSDVSADAKLRTYGVGIKTFIENNKRTFQKVAEFNSQIELYNKLDIKEKIEKISDLRNKRLNFTKKSHGISSLIYHCVVRNEEGFHLYEEDMHEVDISNISVGQSKKENIISFNDGVNDYQFNISKSTLYKRFNTHDYFASIGVSILLDPLEELRKLNLNGSNPVYSDILVLPLYSFKRGTCYKFVPEKSGLNQWNAGGRKRNENEVYIPFPADIRNEFQDFFPARDTPFDVELPDGRTMSMKICQSDGKAIMSNPNKALGEWILRDILDINSGEILTYDMLLEIGIDCVIFEKIGTAYKLNFGEVGMYDDFYEKEILKDYT